MGDYIRQVAALSGCMDYGVLETILLGWDLCNWEVAALLRWLLSQVSLLLAC